MLQPWNLSWDAGFIDLAVEPPNGDWNTYSTLVYSVSLGNGSLTFTSPDGRIAKTIALSGDTLNASYSSNNLLGVAVGFGLTVNMGAMMSRDWWAKLHDVDTATSHGWRSDAGGSAVVGLGGASLVGTASFLNATAPGLMHTPEDINDFTADDWIYYPLHAMTLAGPPSFQISLTLKTGGEQEDFDGDGIANAADPHPLDTDNDGIDNADDPDDDNDGMSDAFETAHGLDPLDAADAGLDPDGDGLTNLDEFTHGTDPGAADGDGLNDAGELAAGTDPYDADTDGDGAPDGAEVAEGRDPLKNEPAALLGFFQMILAE